MVWQKAKNDMRAKFVERFLLNRPRGSVIFKKKEEEVRFVRSKVKWFNNEKGYGFIEYNDKEDIFVHYSAINKEGFKTLKEGQVVEFKLIETTKGLQATDVVEVELATIK